MEPRGYSRDFALDSEKDGESDKGFQACTTLVTSLVLDTRHKEVGLEVGRPARGGLVQQTDWMPTAIWIKVGES